MKRPGILLLNLLIMIGYSVVVQSISFSEKIGAGMMVAELMMLCLFVHVATLVVGAIIHYSNDRNKQAGVWLLSGFLVAIIGFGTCMGNAALADLHSLPAIN